MDVAKIEALRRLFLNFMPGKVQASEWADFPWGIYLLLGDFIDESELGNDMMMVRCRTLALLMANQREGSLEPTEEPDEESFAASILLHGIIALSRERGISKKKEGQENA